YLAALANCSHARAVKEPLDRFNEQQIAGHGRRQKQIIAERRNDKDEDGTWRRERNKQPSQHDPDSQDGQQWVGKAPPRRLAGSDDKYDEGLGCQGLDKAAGLEHRLAGANKGKKGEQEGG